MTRIRPYAAILRYRITVRRQEMKRIRKRFRDVQYEIEELEAELEGVLSSNEVAGL